jgi:type IV pilus assembly protein PilA
MKKGFTLIELMAVIVILGVIALIMVPVTSNMISKAREKSALESAQNYLKLLGQELSLGEMEDNSLEDGEYTIDDINETDIVVKGNKPDSGSINITDGKIGDSVLVFGDYTFNCRKYKCTAGELELEEPDVEIIFNDENHNGERDFGETISIGDEEFYIISFDESTHKTRALAKYPLNVGYELSKDGEKEFVNNNDVAYYSDFGGISLSGVTHTKLKPSSIKQDSSIAGAIIKFSSNFSTSTIRAKGVINFERTSTAVTVDDDFNVENYSSYWINASGNLLSKYGSSYPANVYDSNSNIYSYINEYVEGLKNITQEEITGDLLKLDEMIGHGCEIEITEDTGDSDNGPSATCMKGRICTQEDVDDAQIYPDANMNPVTCTSVGQKIVDNSSDLFFGSSYWLGTASSATEVYATFSLESGGMPYDMLNIIPVPPLAAYYFAVRPVIEF